MKELFYRLWTTESYAVRSIRVLFVGVGTAIAAGQIPLPLWVGVVLSLVGAAITGTDSKSGIPEGGD